MHSASHRPCSFAMRMQHKSHECRACAVACARPSGPTYASTPKALDHGQGPSTASSRDQIMVGSGGKARKHRVVSPHPPVAVGPGLLYRHVASLARNSQNEWKWQPLAHYTTSWGQYRPGRRGSIRVGAAAKVPPALCPSSCRSQLVSHTRVVKLSRPPHFCPSSCADHARLWSPTL
jgi:hypothetical protein